MVSVRKRGKVYEYRIEIASIDGVRKWLTKSGFKTRQEALHEGAIAYNEYYQYGKKQKQKDMSYADYLDYWIDNYCNFNLKYSTIVTYLNIIKLYLKPRLGMYKLSQLDSQMLQEFINDLYVEKNLSKWYLKGILKTIKGSLKYACYTVNFINDNPAERVHIPRYEVVCGDPAHIFTQEEIERILDRFKDVHYIYYSFLTAYYTGLRVSEVFGLTWDCIDFENKTLTINKNIIKENQFGLPKRKNITKGHSVGVWYYGDCKNPQSKRTISIEQLNNKDFQEKYLFWVFEKPINFQKEIFSKLINLNLIKNVDSEYLAIKFYSPIYYFTQRYLLSGELTEKTKEQFRLNVDKYIENFYSEIMNFGAEK